MGATQSPAAADRSAVDTARADALARAALALARRFAHGGTLWCVAPHVPAHARHVEVEFVHPVTVGARALPATSLDGGTAVATLRALAGATDAVLAIADADDPVVREIMRRSTAWGPTTIWIGRGDRPPAGAADHVVWLDDPAGVAVADGELVLCYHLLWELTHVCFEHPGLLTGEDPCGEGVECITCADEGRVAEVVDVSDGGDATVRTPGGLEVVDTTLVGELCRHDLVLVHAGTVIAVVDGERQ